MAKKVKYTYYDPLELIELIEQRPCHWDKTLDDYKDQVKRRIAWAEIYSFLIDDYENLEEDQKIAEGKLLIFIIVFN